MLFSMDEEKEKKELVEVGTVPPSDMDRYTNTVSTILDWASGGNPEKRDFFKEMDDDPEFQKSYQGFMSQFKKEHALKKKGGASDFEVMQAELLNLMLGENPYYTLEGEYYIYNEDARINHRLLRRAGMSEGPRLIKNLRRLQLTEFAKISKGSNPGIKLKHVDPEKKISDATRKEMRKWEEVFARKFFFLHGYSKADLATVMGASYEDFFDLDKISLYIRRARNEQPLGLILMDSALIKPIIPKGDFSYKYDRWDQGEIEIPGEELGRSNVPAYKDNYRWMLIKKDGSRRAKFTDKTLVCKSFFTRTDSYDIYKGLGIIEQGMRIVTSIINTVTFNASRMSNNRIPRGVIALEGGANVSRRQVEYFKKLLWAQTMGSENRWRVPIIALPEKNSIKWTQFDSSSSEMQLFDWLSFLYTVLCQLSGTDPEEISIASNRSAMTRKNALIEESSEATVRRSQDRGLRNFLNYFSSIVNATGVVQELTGHEDWELGFGGLDIVDEKKRRDLQVVELQTAKSINELRSEDDKQHGELIIGDTNIYDVIAPGNQVVIQAIQAKIQEDALEKQMEQQRAMEAEAGGEEEYSEADQALIDQYGAPEGGPGEEEAQSEAAGGVEEKATAQIEKSVRKQKRGGVEEIVVTLEG